MLDIKFIREEPEKVKQACKAKQVQVDIDKLLEIDKKTRKVLQETETLKAQRNIITQEISKQKTLELIKQAQKIKEKINEREKILKNLNPEYQELLYAIPNPALDDVPEGKDESENVVLREVSEKTKLDFKPKPHWEIGEELDIIDTQRAGKVSGSRFGFLKGKGALLEFALINFALENLNKENFIPIIPPILIRPEMMGGMGYVKLKMTERDKKIWQGEEMYFLRDDDLLLAGTSEQMIGPMHSKEIFEEKDLPKRYVGFSSCFRREAGAYGKDVRGILRVHQFDKVEMFIFSKPENAIKEHELMLSLEESLMQKLEIPYRVVKMCTGDLGDPAASKYDIEAWFPGQNEYRETHSTSNCTDFQARRLNIRYRDSKDNELKFVYMLNGTALAIGRTILAILENYQQKDGSVKIPNVLQKYLGFREVEKK
ncbi:MAG: serine--tRNA ligase [Candidatus Pacebacteria bacterium]|nr:serine--tRNA ligase [Candidatus Paceibacterota bacterium]